MTITLPKSNEKHIKQLSEEYQRQNPISNDSDQALFQFICKFDEY